MTTNPIANETDLTLWCDGLVLVAQEWHGGQFSALYSIGSTATIANWKVLTEAACELADAVSDVEAGRADIDDVDEERLRRCAEWLTGVAESNPYAKGNILADKVPDPGGYGLLAYTDDGDVLCEQCATDPYNPVHPAIAGHPDGWGIIGWASDGETESETDLPCVHCNKVLIEGYDNER